MVIDKDMVSNLKRALFLLRTELDDDSLLVELPYDAAKTMYDLLKELPTIVKCKDCKHRFNGCCYDKKSDRINFGVYVADDWFCADGERR